MNPYTAPGGAAAFPDAPPAYGASGASQVSEAVVEVLRQTRTWVLLMGILSLIVSVFMALGGLAVGGIALLSTSLKSPQAALALLYFPLACLYVYPALKLLGYSSAIVRLVASRSSADLENALAQQRAFWKFCGIAAIVVMVLYAVILAGAVAFGIFAATSAKSLTP